MPMISSPNSSQAKRHADPAGLNTAIMRPNGGRSRAERRRERGDTVAATWRNSESIPNRLDLQHAVTTPIAPSI